MIIERCTKCIQLDDLLMPVDGYTEIMTPTRNLILIAHNCFRHNFFFPLFICFILFYTIPCIFIIFLTHRCKFLAESWTGESSARPVD